MAQQPAYFIEGSTVDEALGQAGRVYLTGHLERPQEALDHIDSLDQPVELGLTRYETLTVDTPHLHERNTDLTYVLQGRFAVRIVATGEACVLGAGGLCVITPGIGHVCVAEPGTQVLFCKVPGGNDKVPITLDEASQRWVEASRAAFSRA